MTFEVYNSRHVCGQLVRIVQNTTFEVYNNRRVWTISLFHTKIRPLKYTIVFVCEQLLCLVLKHDI